MGRGFPEASSNWAPAYPASVHEVVAVLRRPNVTSRVPAAPPEPRTFKARLFTAQFVEPAADVVPELDAVVELVEGVEDVELVDDPPAWWELLLPPEHDATARKRQAGTVVHTLDLTRLRS